jgi:radical SAM superfamily enzyme YgiQ (UPF0313 family)
MNILLIYPEFPDTFWSFRYALQFIRKKAVSPPLGLLTVAALLPSGWNKRLVDMNVSPLTGADLEWADYAFVSAMQIQRRSAIEAIRRCKAAGLTVVAGGPLFSTENERPAGVDSFVLNEGELTLPIFLADLARGRMEPVYRTDDFADLTKSPVPLWDLADQRRYDTMSLQFSRGCPYGCDFCNVTVLLGHRPRTKSAAQIIAELDSLYATGWRGSVFFVDDNFIGNKKQLKEEVLPALVAWRKGKTGMPFNTEVSINLADDDELLQLMVEAGFDSVFVGIETPDEEGLIECHKTQNRNRDLEASVRHIQRAGLRLQAGFIVGFDSDTPSIFQRQIDFIQKTGIVTAMVGILQAPYGTPLYKRLQREGRLSREMTGDNVDGLTNIIPKMDLTSLRDGYKRILGSIYRPKLYYERVRAFLREYRPPKIKPHLQLQHVLALFRSVYLLGIKGVERVEYWRLLLWALFRKPRLFPLAITLSIYGYHFRKVSELHVQ